MTDKPRTAKHESVRNSLPPELVPVFDELVADYQFHTTVRHGNGFVSYGVIAELVKAGWRFAGPEKQEKPS
jgi:hypothetical protein